MEYKALVSISTFKKLQGYLPTIANPKGIYHQTNYYFDIPDMVLKSKNITLRLREKHEKWELTMKVPIKNDYERCTSKEEFNFSISQDEALFYLHQGISGKDCRIQKVLKELEIELSLYFVHLGSLETRREEFSFYTDIISLDHNLYNGIEDFEIEWETTNHRFVQSQFDQLGLSELPSQGKKSRFLKSFKEEVDKVVR